MFSSSTSSPRSRSTSSPSCTSSSTSSSTATAHGTGSHPQVLSFRTSSTRRKSGELRNPGRNVSLFPSSRPRLGSSPDSRCFSDSPLFSFSPKRPPSQPPPHPLHLPQVSPHPLQAVRPLEVVARPPKTKLPERRLGPDVKAGGSGESGRAFWDGLVSGRWTVSLNISLPQDANADPLESSFSRSYPSILARLLGLKLVPSQPILSRMVSYEFMNRQLVWGSFAVRLALVLSSTRRA